MENKKIFIKGNVPSSKNGRRNYKRISLPSKATIRWRNNSVPFWIKNTKVFKKMKKGKTKPYRICFLFVRGTRHRFDYINPAQTIQDEMVKYGWIDDDDANNIIPIFAPYSYDKDEPGVYIYFDE